MKHVALLPNLITLANAFCGLLAIARSIDALAYTGEDPAIFYAKMESACLLVFVAMVFDAMDGKLARITRSATDFGAQLDSFSDLITFGLAPAIIAKAMIEHEGPLVGYDGSPRLHFLAAAAYSLMALLRLARFNLENDGDKEEHGDFSGVPSPAAAGAVVSTLWLYLVLRRPELESSGGMPTPFGRIMGWMETIDWSPILSWIPAAVTIQLLALGLLMVSRVRYAHLTTSLSRKLRTQFVTLVWVVFGLFLFYLAPVPMLFVTFNGFVVFGIVRTVFASRKAARAAADSGTTP